MTDSKREAPLFFLLQFLRGVKILGKAVFKEGTLSIPRTIQHGIMGVGGMTIRRGGRSWEGEGKNSEQPVSVPLYQTFHTDFPRAR